MTQFDETFDWVVVGSGAGSMASGLLMRRAGKSVVILEKSSFVGGTTCKSGGMMWLPDNPFMEQGEDSVEAGITYLDAVVGDGDDRPGTSHEKRLAYIVEGRKMIEFLLRQGVELERGSHFWPDYYDEYPGGCKTSRTVVAKPFDKRMLGAWAPKLRQGFLEMPVRVDDAIYVPFASRSWAIKWSIVKIGVRIVLGKLTGKHWVSAGAALQGRMLQQALKAGVDIRLDSPAGELVVENGSVTGVATLKDGRPWRVGARLGVLINAGGFAKNQEMRDRYMPGTRTEWSMANESDTGDMHREMERHGGVLAQMDEMVGFQMSRAPGWEKDRHRQAACYSRRPVRRSLHERGRVLRSLLRRDAGTQPHGFGSAQLGHSGFAVHGEISPGQWRIGQEDTAFMDRFRLYQAGRYDRRPGQADRGRSGHPARDGGSLERVRRQGR